MVRIKNFIKAIIKKYLRKKKYLIIRRKDRTAGLGSFIVTNVGYINYALENDLIPIIDMQTVDNSLLEPNKKNIENSWEYFFKQPMGISYSSKIKNKVVVTGVPKKRPNDTMDFLTNSKAIDYWRKIFNKYLVLNDDIEKHIDDIYNRLISKDDKVLGVLCRGTDYITLKPFGHPIQPDLDEVFEKVDETLSATKCNKIFLATEDLEYLEKFKNKYGEKLLYIDTLRFSNTGNKYLSEIINERENDKYIKALDYLTTLKILSRCNSLVAGRTSGSVCAYLFSKGYEYSYFWNYGRYGIDDISMEDLDEKEI